MKNHIVIWLLMVILFGVSLLIVGCDSSDRVSQSVEDGSDQTPNASVRILPTVYPTGTLAPAATPTNTKQPEPTQIPDTPVAFDQVVVNLRYSIPGLGLDRRIQANVSNQIEVIDEATGETIIQRNQPGILLEMQQALSEVELAELPADCDFCVHLEYELPISEESDSGWLDDVRLLASLENYTNVLLGPYFPEKTLVGLRRSATPYQVAHTIALDEDGWLWFWTAAESEIDPPQKIDLSVQGLSEALVVLESGALADNYSASCPGSTGRETLYFGGGDEAKYVVLTCPELSLPTGLTVLYQTLDELAAGILPETGADRPEPSMPLDALLHFRRDDGQELTIYRDGMTIAVSPESAIYTGTVTSTLVLSLTTELVNNGLLNLGADALTAADASNVLTARTNNGVYETSWMDAIGGELGSFVAWLNELIENSVALAAGQSDRDLAETREPGVTPSPTGEATRTP